MAGNFFAKAIGAAAIGLVTYDAVATTENYAARYTNSKLLERVDDVYLRTDSLPTDSVVQSKMQKWARNWHMDNNWLLGGIDKIVGTIGGFFGHLGSNLVTLGLGATALLCGKGKFSKFKIPYVGKIAATILAIKAGSFVLGDLFGIGSPNPRRNDFRY